MSRTSLDLACDSNAETLFGINVAERTFSAAKGAHSQYRRKRNTTISRN